MATYHSIFKINTIHCSYFLYKSNLNFLFNQKYLRNQLFRIPAPNLVSLARDIQAQGRSQDSEDDIIDNPAPAYGQHTAHRRFVMSEQGEYVLD